MANANNSVQVLDSREVIDSILEVQGEITAVEAEREDAVDEYDIISAEADLSTLRGELESLEAFLAEIKEATPDWDGANLVLDDYFDDYARETATRPLIGS